MHGPCALCSCSRPLSLRRDNDAVAAWCWGSVAAGGHVLFPNPKRLYSKQHGTDRKP